MFHRYNLHLPGGPHRCMGAYILATAPSDFWTPSACSWRQRTLLAYGNATHRLLGLVLLFPTSHRTTGYRWHELAAPAHTFRRVQLEARFLCARRCIAGCLLRLYLTLCSDAGIVLSARGCCCGPASGASGSQPAQAICRTYACALCSRLAPS
eukprot:6191903-Pleurochrysis_carterae.AAC.3